MVPTAIKTISTKIPQGIKAAFQAGFFILQGLENEILQKNNDKRLVLDIQRMQMHKKAEHEVCTGNIKRAVIYNTSSLLNLSRS